LGVAAELRAPGTGILVMAGAEGLIERSNQAVHCARIRWQSDATLEDPEALITLLTQTPSPPLRWHWDPVTGELFQPAAEALTSPEGPAAARAWTELHSSCGSR
jgi:hypothetical protein